jgi:hypothetical protein
MVWEQNDLEHTLVDTIKHLQFVFHRQNVRVCDGAGDVIRI